MSDKLKPANENPDFGKVCSHGQLKRKCLTCDLEGDILLRDDVIKELIKSLKEIKRDLEICDWSCDRHDCIGELDMTETDIYDSAKGALAFAKEKLK